MYITAFGSALIATCDQDCIRRKERQGWCIFLHAAFAWLTFFNNHSSNKWKGWSLSSLSHNEWPLRYCHQYQQPGAHAEETAWKVTVWGQGQRNTVMTLTWRWNCLKATWCIFICLNLWRQILQHCFLWQAKVSRVRGACMLQELGKCWCIGVQETWLKGEKTNWKEKE